MKNAFYFILRFTNADMKIYQYLRLYVKIIYRRFRIITLIFEIYAPKMYEMFVCKHTETKKYVKK